MEKPSESKEAKPPGPPQNDSNFILPSPNPNFGSYHSPSFMNFGGENSSHRYSIPSANGGSFHNYFGRSPPIGIMNGGMTPLQSLLNSQHKVESPQFLPGKISLKL